MESRLRIYFMFDRKRLTKLSRCAWKVLSRYLKQTAAFEDAVPGAVIAVQSFGDFLGFNSHLHVLGTDPPEADFYGNGSFKTCPTPNPKGLEGPSVFFSRAHDLYSGVGIIN